MKKILLLLCLLITYSFAFSQTEKDKWFAAGYSSLRLDIGKEKYKSGGTTHEYNTYRHFDFNPMVGYFIIDKLPVGLYIDLSARRVKDSDDGDIWKETEFVAGPFVRYYVVQIDKLVPFVEGRIGLGAYKEDDEGDIYKESVFSYRFGAGASYFFTDNVAFDSFIGYDYDRYTSVDNADEYSYFYPSVEINFGIVITFGK
ncbi:MAG TPA: outer membrane beta-barrel protein [Bacteroidales bacterium]|nr:outer membrane beta-barrel protein [Bacteroidales bacterium]